MIGDFSPIPALLLPWYDRNKRTLPWRGGCDPYQIWVSEIMLQQTRVTAVIPYYTRWMERLPDVKALAQVPEEELMKLWEGLGYYSRARNLKKAAGVIVEELSGNFPRDFKSLQKLPGIGEYTAGAIASIAFGEPVPAVDGNVLRVAARFGGVGEDILDPKVKKAFFESLVPCMPKDRPGDLNQAFMDLGATVCLPNGAPLCESCPLASCCAARREGTQMELPVKRKKAPRRVEEKTVFLLMCRDKIALRKRPDTGLLAGLWEFPSREGVLTPQAAAEALTGLGVAPRTLLQQLHSRHIFTHVEWHMTGYLFTVEEPSGAFTWVSREELSRCAVPSAFARFLEAVLEEL